MHFTLCGGTVAKLGTERHHREILPRMDTLDLPGCFGMTELGHGSNVMGIETTVSIWVWGVLGVWRGVAWLEL